MSLMSKSDTMRAKGQQAGASEVEILRAALLEGQEQYSELSQELVSRLDALEAAVRASNAEKGMEVSAALENAVESVLARLRAKEEQEEQPEPAEGSESMTIAAAAAFGAAVVAAALGNSLALWAWGRWYGVPAKLDAINNALWLMSR